ncbi:MAG: hypothetical protein MI748_07940 [Opitutales bacterium]|nr:hypothetical protein [Opitutales bacterium]
MSVLTLISAIVDESIRGKVVKCTHPFSWIMQINWTEGSPFIRKSIV